MRHLTQGILASGATSPFPDLKKLAAMNPSGSGWALSGVVGSIVSEGAEIVDWSRQVWLAGRRD